MKSYIESGDKKMAKYIIELDDEYYKQATSNVIKHNMDEMVDAYEIAIANATPLEGATNGDMIKAIFPNGEYGTNDNFVHVYIPFNGIIQTMTLDISWWDAPYKKEVEE